MVVICEHLDRIAKMYQIPNYDLNVNSILLAEWIMDEYKHQDIELVLETLRKPPVLKDTTWRLTPDTIAEWVDYTRVKMAEKKERIESQKRQVTFDVPDDTELSQETKDLVQNYLNSLAGFKSVSPMTAEDVKREGKEKLKAKSLSQGHPFAAKEKLIEWQLKQQWMKECFHPITQEPNENYLSFEEWRMM